MEFLETTVTSIEHLEQDYTLLVFQASTPIFGEPGQFVMIRGADFGADPILPRAFSLVSSGSRGAVLVKAVGKATHRLSSLRRGDRLMVLGPLGNHFSLPKASVHPILVAGGVGVAPLIFMAERLREAGRGSTFIYGGRTAKDLLFLDRIESAAGELIVTTEDGSAGVKGRVTDVLSSVTSRSEPMVAYSCGPDPMLRALYRALPPAIPLEVALEQAMACGMGTCKGCAVYDRKGEYKYVCSDGPIFAADEIFGEEA